MITLYSNKRGVSPACRKAQIVLEEKGLPYEKINQDPEFLPDEWKKMNPNLTVSLLVDNGRYIFESANMVDYLFRTYPGSQPAAVEPPLAEYVTRPDHHIDDAMVLSTIETVLASMIRHFLFTSSGADPGEIKPWGWVWARDYDRIQSCLDWLDKQATPEGFVPGVFSVMDLGLMCALLHLDVLGSLEFKNNPFPGPWRDRSNLFALFQRYQTRPSIIATALVPG